MVDPVIPLGNSARLDSECEWGRRSTVCMQISFACCVDKGGVPDPIALSSLVPSSMSSTVVQVASFSSF